MLRWAIVFLVVAGIAALFGFGGIAGGLTGFAKAAFITFAIIFLVFLFAGMFRRQR